MLPDACCLLAGLLTLVSAKASPYSSIRWWELGNDGSVVGESNSIPQSVRSFPVDPGPDGRMSLLTRQQRRLLTRNTGSAAAVSKATRSAREECQYQFRHKTWNCSTVKASGSGFIFGDLVGIGCRETAFLYAIMSAAATVEVARACGEGTIYTCSCYRGRLRRLRPHPNGGTTAEDSGAGNGGGGGNDWTWGGCGDNLRFGNRIAERLEGGGGGTHEPEKRHLQAAVNRHNSAAGRATVEGLKARHCKCHGTSGSCSLQTCWVVAPQMRLVGNQLMRKYEAAKMVDPDNRNGGFQPRDTKQRMPAADDLIYYRDSPNFCNPNTRLGIEGTHNRECNSTAPAGDVSSCQSLCCGRGYRTEPRKTLERCNCKFHWCCDVTCELCEKFSKWSSCN